MAQTVKFCNGRHFHVLVLNHKTQEIHIPNTLEQLLNLIFKDDAEGHVSKDMFPSAQPFFLDSSSILYETENLPSIGQYSF